MRQWEFGFCRADWGRVVTSLLLVGLFVCLLLLPGIGQADSESFEISIPASPADESIKALSRQTGYSAIYQSNDVANVLTQSVNGRYTVQGALDALFGGTALSGRLTTMQVITISHRDEDKNHGEIEMKVNKRMGFLVGVAAFFAGGTGTAVAQDGAQNAAPATIEEIVVTAQKREENLQDVPIAITALSAQTLVTSGQVRIQDYYTRVPGLNVTTDNRGGASVSIRGITSGQYSNPTVGITVDNVPFGSVLHSGGGQYMPDLDPSDLARVEVLKGPQGTFYGASSLGGLINFVTIDPSTTELSGRVQAGVNTIRNGDGPGYTGRGAINVPVSDTFAFRASAFKRYDTGYIDNALTGERGQNWEENTGGRLSVLWQATEGISLKLTAMVQNQDRSGSPEVRTDPAFGEFENDVAKGAGYYAKDFRIYMAQVKANLGQVDFVSATGYTINNQDISLDLPWLNAESKYGVSGSKYSGDIFAKKFSQEFRFSSTGGHPVEWLAGLYYTHENVGLDEYWLAIDPVSGVESGVEYYLLDTHPTLQDYAIFADFTFKVTDKFDIQVGGRGNKNKQVYPESSIAIPVWDVAPYVTPSLSTDETVFTYLFAPRYKLSPDIMLYARLASGYRPGGPTFFGAPPYKADRTQNYEAGIKGSSFNGRLSFDASAYYIDWKDIQLFVSDMTGSYIGNAAAARSEGVELSVEAKPIKGLTLGGWVAYSDAEITETSPPPVTVPAFKGDKMPFNSPFSASLSIDQKFFVIGDINGYVGATWSYVDKRVGGFRANSTIRQDTFPSYTTLDLRAGIQSTTWSVDAYVNNPLDKRGVLSGDPVVARTVFYTRPRNIGVTYTKSF